MPFIRGRYHINPVMGEALEAAREAEEALQELQRQAEENGAADDDAAKAGARRPVHRVEIDAAEMVRPQAGHAQRGYTVRVHRGVRPSDDDATDFDDEPATQGKTAPETQVFAGHQDLLDFLREELERDSKR